MTRFVLVIALASGCGGKAVTIEHLQYQEQRQAFELTRSSVTTLECADEGMWCAPRIADLHGEHVLVEGGGDYSFNRCRVPDRLNDVTLAQYQTLGVINRAQPVDVQYNMDHADDDGDGKPDEAVVASDHDSLGLLTAYTNFDDVLAFYRDVLGDASWATSTRARVAMYSTMGVGCEPTGVGQGGVTVPGATTDRAFYVPTADTFAIMRDGFWSSGVELSNNVGIVAHEFAHRVFMANVHGSDRAFHNMLLQTLGTRAQSESTCTSPPGSDDVDPCRATGDLLRAMNEGTADIFAYAYTGAPDFLLSQSLSPLSFEEPVRRDVSRDPEEDLREYSPAIVRDAVDGSLNVYRLGTLWARAFFQGVSAADDGRAPKDAVERVAWVRAVHGPALLRALGRLGVDLGVQYRFDPRQLLRRYLQELPIASRASACMSLCLRFGREPVRAVNQIDVQCEGIIAGDAARSFACQL